MEPRPLIAALLLLLATWIPWALSFDHELPPEGCSDRTLAVAADPLRLRGELPVALCAPSCSAGACGAPLGAAALLLGRPIDINRAGAAELAALPDVGPGMARRIVADRERAGPFATLGALRRIKGVGAARIRALEGFAHAGPAPPPSGLPPAPPPLPGNPLPAR